MIGGIARKVGHMLRVSSFSIVVSQGAKSLLGAPFDADDLDLRLIFLMLS